MKRDLKTIPGMTMALLTTASLVACGAAAEETGPAGITLADASEVLNVIDALPPRFSRVDPDLQGYSREDLGVPPDASVVETFQAESPFQRVFCFLRIMDDEGARRQVGLTLFDEANIRSVMSYYLAAVADDIDAGIGTQIDISYPRIAAGAALAEGEVTTDEFTLRVEMLRFRSQDSRVFVYVNSFYVGDDPEPAVNIAREVERRITDFGSQQTLPGEW
ncbi:MAG: hypothetical protein V3S10_00410 [Dehalococcoidales bacterium]